MKNTKEVVRGIRGYSETVLNDYTIQLEFIKPN